MDATLRRMLVPLALTQFIASFAGTAMSVSITSISKDLHTDVHGVQVAITLFLLTMAALMITGSKLTDIWGRKFCFQLGLLVYGVGAVLSALARALPLLFVGYSVGMGVGSALMIPPVYIITTALFTDTTARAKAFGAIMASAGIASAAGPLIGGLITTGISWRWTFGLEAAAVVVTALLGRAVQVSEIQGAKPRFDLLGAILSAAGMFFIVLGIVQASVNFSQLVLFVVIGLLVLGWFYLHVRSVERKGGEPLLRTDLFKNKVSNLGQATQNIQWLLLLGSQFVISVYLQVVRGYSAIQTGIIFTAATIGILLTSAAQGRLAQRFAQKTLIVWGFLIAFAGIALLLAFARATSPPLYFLPGLFVFGVGMGLMVTPSVNIVQSAWPDSRQGEISGLSRSVSNLGSSFGTAIGGAVLAIAVAAGNKSYALALVVISIIGLLGLLAAFFLPGGKAAQPSAAATTPPPGAPAGAH